VNCKELIAGVSREVECVEDGVLLRGQLEVNKVRQLEGALGRLQQGRGAVIRHCCHWLA
jgi:hypothetical protein